MRAELILLPMIAQMLLTFAVWLLLYRVRIGGMKRARIHPQRMATRAQKAEVTISQAEQQVSDNFMNLFELPVIFYALCLTLYVTGLATMIEVVLAWLFVAARALHTFIHVSYNRVVHRFLAYLAGGLLLLALLLRTGWSLL
ncbi:MAG TPA: MAPEG family protein [Gammaproteobacteria bacterium]|nr:MAPEG family protein [Gammaproteobacteria bacterium]